MDDFRRCQKALCLNGAPNNKDPYGCGCCRKIMDQGQFKKWSRKLSRRRLAYQDRLAFRQYLSY